MNDFTMAYLERIGLSEPPPRTDAGLALLQRAHLRHVPFECLDVIAGRPLSLSPDRLFDKVVRRRRGGFCYELNSLFARLLEAVGFDVTVLSAGVVDREGSVGPDFDHMTLRVDLDNPWLVDVGFGRSFLEPLSLRAEEAEDPAGRFRLRPEEDRWWLERYEPLEEQADETGWVRLYRFDLEPRSIEDFGAMFEYHQTSPNSPFTRDLVVSQATETGRLTVRGLEVFETVDGRRSRSSLESERARRDFLERRFGLFP